MTRDARVPVADLGVWPTPSAAPDLGDLPALLAGSRLPDHLRDAIRPDADEPAPDEQPGHDEGTAE